MDDFSGPDMDDSPKRDRRRFIHALNASLGFVLLLVLAYSAQDAFDWRPFAVGPWSAQGLVGILTAPLLHGSAAHLMANAGALVILGTLAGSVYPRATLWSLPLLWLGSGLGAWLLGEPGTRHLGASGVTHGLMFLVFVLGILRRDRAAIATGMIAFLFYGSMLLTILPREIGVSWEAHMGGALGGVLAAILFRRLDPMQPRKRYSWEEEEEAEEAAREAAARHYAGGALGRDRDLEPPAPPEVPVLWRRPADDEWGKVIPFRPRRPAADAAADDGEGKTEQAEDGAGTRPRERRGSDPDNGGHAPG